MGGNLARDNRGASGRHGAPGRRTGIGLGRRPHLRLRGAAPILRTALPPPAPLPPERLEIDHARCSTGGQREGALHGEARRRHRLRLIQGSRPDRVHHRLAQAHPGLRGWRSGTRRRRPKDRLHRARGRLRQARRGEGDHRGPGGDLRQARSAARNDGAGNDAAGHRGVPGARCQSGAGDTRHKPPACRQAAPLRTRVGGDQRDLSPWHSPHGGSLET